jgi:hypothetical protein
MSDHDGTTYRATIEGTLLRTFTTEQEAKDWVDRVLDDVAWNGGEIDGGDDAVIATVEEIPAHVFE